MRRLLATWQHFSLLARPLLHSDARVDGGNRLRHYARRCVCVWGGCINIHYKNMQWWLIIESRTKLLAVLQHQLHFKQKKAVLTQTNQSSWFIGFLVLYPDGVQCAPLESQIACSHLQGPRACCWQHHDHERNWNLIKCTPRNKAATN